MACVFAMPAVGRWGLWPRQSMLFVSRCVLTTCSARNKNSNAQPHAHYRQFTSELAPRQQREHLRDEGFVQDNNQRLTKVLAAAGVASRRACEELLKQGVVKVNGQLVWEQAFVDPGKDQVEVRGKAVDISQIGQAHYYFAVNKPKGFICSEVERDGRRGSRAVDLLQPWLDTWTSDSKQTKGALPPRLFTVGRLDVSSSGLLLLTNDGEWGNKVIHPSSGLTKEYYATVGTVPTRQQLAKMSEGVEVDGTLVVPVEVEGQGGLERVRVVVAEGKKHEVRLLLASVGLEVLALKRVRIGGLCLPPWLKLGQYRELSSSEVRSVTDLAAQASAARGDKGRRQAPPKDATSKLKGDPQSEHL